MCPHCRAFITTADKVCPYCDTAVAPRRIEWAASSDFFLTPLILLINVGLFIVTIFASMKSTGGGGFLDVDGRTLFSFGAKLSPAIAAGQWWRLITAGFLHGGLMHIFMNSYAFLDLGRQVEMYYGARRMVVIYILSTIGGFYLSSVWSEALSIGASAGLMGLLGAMLALTMQHQGPAASYLRGMYTRYAVWVLAIGLLPGLRIDNAAHIGGFAVGFGVGYLAHTQRGSTRTAERTWGVLAILCICLTLYAFLRWYLWFSGVTRI